jgi:hypothetical protein
VGRKYHYIFVPYAGVTLAQMDEIRVVANGKTIQRFTGTERDNMNQADGYAGAAAGGMLTIPFDRPGLITRAGQEETALNTGGPGFNSLSIEMDINAGAAAPAFADIRAEVSAGDPSSIGTVLHIRKFTRAATGAGDLDIADIPYGGPTMQRLNRMFFSSTVITGFLLQRNQYEIMRRTTALNALIQAQGGYKTVVANFASLDPTERGYGGDGISMIADENGQAVSDFRWTLTFSGAGSVTLIQETLGVLGD